MTEQREQRGQNAQKQSVPGAGEMVLARDRYYSMNDFETRRNNNVLIVGTAGAGKTRGVVAPNILQATGSYIVSDPKGNLCKKYGPYLMGKGYRVTEIDFVHPGISAHYNPLHYIRSEKDVLKLAHLLAYTQSTQERTGGDAFWEQAVELLFTALIAYLTAYRPREEQTLAYVTKLVNAAVVNENNADIKTPLDRIMDEVERRDRKSYALNQYRKYRVAAGKTQRSVQISANVKLNAMDFPGMQEMMSGESIDFTALGREKTAVFVNVSDSDRSMDDLANIFFTQAMQELCRYADDECENSRLPVPVRFILDDFATNVMIDDFPRMIASIRSRGISAMLCVQDEAQLITCYGNAGLTVANNCDTYLYLGGSDGYTVGNVSRRADVPMHRVLNMPVGTGWLLRRGEEPVLVHEFDLEAFEHTIFGRRKIAAMAAER